MSPYGSRTELIAKPRRFGVRWLWRRILPLLLLIFSGEAQADRIKDIARFAGIRANALTGYGLVVGLSGTGDDNLDYTVQSMKSTAARLGVTLPPGIAPGLKNAAAVIVTAELPAFAKAGQRLGQGEARAVGAHSGDTLLKNRASQPWRLASASSPLPE